MLGILAWAHNASSRSTRTIPTGGPAHRIAVETSNRSRPLLSEGIDSAGNWRLVAPRRQLVWQRHAQHALAECDARMIGTHMRASRHGDPFEPFLVGKRCFDRAAQPI